MQALYTHLEQPFTQGPPKGFSVQGVNTLFQGESSFEKLLKQTAYSQDLKAKEGPPEQRSVRVLQTEERSREVAESSRVRDGKTDSAEKNAAERAAENEGKSSADKAGRSAPDEHALDESTSEEHTDEKSAARALSSEKPSRSSAETAEAAEAAKAAEAAENAARKNAQGRLAGGDEEEGESAVLGAADEVRAGKTAVLRDENSKDAPDEKPEAENVQDSGQLNFAASFAQTADTQSVKTGRKEGAAFQKTREERAFSVQDMQDAQNVKREAFLAEIPSVIVRDERTKAPRSAEDKKQSLSASIRYDGKGSAQADLFLTAPDASKAGTAFSAAAKEGMLFSRAPEQTGSQAGMQQRFTSMLSAEIRANAADLVKAGSIILRDGNKGTINLTLHPEELGNVKIRLQISDNILTGRITVASEEAYNAFKSNIAALTEAFASNGFDTAGFDLSWSGQNDGRHDGNANADTRNPFAFRYDEQTAFTAEGGASEAEFRYDARPSVNLIA